MIRTRPCPLCHANPGEPCSVKPAGDHLARYLDAYTARLLTRTYMAMVVSELITVDTCAIIRTPPLRAAS